MLRKQVSFEDRKRENAPKLPTILTLLKSNLSYLELFIKHLITAIENIMFEIYLYFIWIQTYRIFFFSRRVFAKHHTISSRCRIFIIRS